MNRDHRQKLEFLAVALIFLFLSIYHLLKRLASNDILGLDHNAMQMALHKECVFPEKLAGIQFTPIYTCTYELLSYVFNLPLLYLVVTVVLKFLTLFGLYLIYRELASRYAAVPSKSIVALGCLTFLLIGGVGRLQLNGDLILKSGIYTGMLAQMCLVYTFYFFVSRKYFFAALVMGLSLLLHTANAIHVFFVLLGAVFLVERSKNLVGSMLLFGVPSLSALVVQYLAWYGMPVAVTESHEILKSMSDTVPSQEYSVSEWYKYVISQDPDDMSLVWNLSNRLGMFYCTFPLVAFFMALRVEKKKTILELIQQPAIAICIMWYLYIALCTLIEVFQFPEFALQKLIVIQPRRAFYVPIIFLSFYVIRYVVEFIVQKNSISVWRGIELGLLVTWFFSFVVSTGNAANLSSRIVIFIFCSVLLLIFARCVLGTLANHIIVEKILNLFRDRLTWVIGILVVVLIRLSSFATPTALENLRITFIDSGSRSYVQYLLAEANARGVEETKKYFLEMTGWIGNNINKSEPILAAGLQEIELMQLEVLSQRAPQSMNVYRYRGLMHFDKRRFNELSSYHSELLGIPVSSMRRSSGTVIDDLEGIVMRFSEEDFCSRTTPEGKPFLFFLTTYVLKVPIPVMFERGPYRVYDLATLRATSKLCRA